LAELLAHARRENARDYVGVPARRRWNHEPDGFLRERLGVRLLQQQEKK
jgi:hypothetical protein